MGNRAQIAGCWVHFILGSLARDEGWLAVAPWADADLIGQAEGDVAAAVLCRAVKAVTSMKS